MSWNFRLVRKEAGEEACYTIHEAYYKTKRGCKGGPTCNCKVTSLSVNPYAPWGGDPEELRKVLEDMLKALDKPALDDRTMKPIKEKKSGQGKRHSAK